MNGSSVAATTTNASVQVPASPQIHATASASVVQDSPPNLSDGSSSQSRGSSSVSPSPTSSMASSNGPSSAGPSSKGGLSESLQNLTPQQRASVLEFDEKLKKSMSEVGILKGLSS